MQIDKELFEDFSETTTLGREKIRALLVKLNEQRDELAAALARYAFANFVGKNVLVHYKTHSIVLIGRSTVFYVYDPSSPYVRPEKYSFGDIIEAVKQSRGEESLDEIESHEIITDEQAIEFIRQMYAKRAEESKKLLAEILDYKE